jgi:serine/threonine protein phosphatase PrpC
MALFIEEPTKPTELPFLGELSSTLVAPAEFGTVSISSCTRQLGKGQDYVFTFSGINYSDRQTFHAMAVFDGHGNDTCINTIRGLPLSHFICMENPLNEIISALKKKKHYYNSSSGSTCVIVKFYREYFELFNCGDSQMMLFEDDKLICFSEAHVLSNADEEARLNAVFGTNWTTVPDWQARVISENRITMVSGCRIVFPSGLRMVPTQSLGHHDEAGYSDFNCKLFNYSLDKRVRIICATDGLWDMVRDKPDIDGVTDLALLSHASAEEIVAFAERKWRQPWECLVVGNKYELTKFPDFDDIGVAVLDYRMV